MYITYTIYIYNMQNVIMPISWLNGRWTDLILLRAAISPCWYTLIIATILAPLVRMTVEILLLLLMLLPSLFIYLVGYMFFRRNLFDELPLIREILRGRFFFFKSTEITTMISLAEEK